MAIEEPKYTVSLHQGAYEIRDYQAAMAAEVTVTGDQRGAASKGFRLLAGYIFGGNTRRQSIAMTAPVTLERRSEEIAMTTPVTQTPTDGVWVVRFTMPDSYSLETLPENNCAGPLRGHSVFRARQRDKRRSQDRRTHRLREGASSARDRASLARPIQPALDPLVHAAERSDDSAGNLIGR